MSVPTAAPAVWLSLRPLTARLSVKCLVWPCPTGRSTVSDRVARHAAEGFSGHAIPPEPGVDGKEPAAGLASKCW